MCRVEHFCCGCTLRTGAITAAVLTGIMALQMLVYGVVVLQLSKDLNTMIPPNEDPNTANKFIAHQISIARAMGGILLFQSILYCCGFIFLVAGIAQTQAVLVIPWLVTIMIGIVFGWILTIMILSEGNYMGLLYGVVYAAKVYIWIVVLNYYKSLRDTVPEFPQYA